MLELLYQQVELLQSINDIWQVNNSRQVLTLYSFSYMYKNLRKKLIWMMLSANLWTCTVSNKCLLPLTVSLRSRRICSKFLSSGRRSRSFRLTDIYPETKHFTSGYISKQNMLERVCLFIYTNIQKNEITHEILLICIIIDTNLLNSCHVLVLYITILKNNRRIRFL